MKTFATLIFVLFIGVVAQAQNNDREMEVAHIEMRVETENAKEIKLEATNEVARLHKFKNSKIKKALSFTIKSNKAKMA